MSTMIYTEEEIDALVEVETKLTSLAFTVSDALGRMAIKSALINFVELLKNQKGKIVLSLDLDYRVFVVNYADSLMAVLDKKHHHSIASEILMPSHADS